MQHLGHLRYFHAVSRTRSIRKAAEQLNVAQSAVSRQIKNLEEELGVQLFDRHARGVRLTDAGEILADYTHQVFLGLEHTRSEIDGLRALRRGTISVGTVEAGIASFLPRVIDAFQQDYPAVKLNLLVRGTQGVVDTVLADEADIGVAFHTPDHLNLEVLASRPQPLNAIVRPEHPLAGRKHLKLAEVAGERLALPGPTFGIRQLVDEIQRKSRLRLEPVLETNSILSLVAFARSGAGVTFLPFFAVKEDVEAGRLIAVPLSDPPARRPTIDVIAHAGRRLPFAAQEFGRRLQAALKALR